MSTTTTGHDALSRIGEARIDELEAALRGRLVRPGDADYDRARRVWNGMIDRHPALIVRCRGVADVIASVELAREHDLLVAVRGGGHNVAGTATCDGGLVIDLSPMRGVRVDPASGTVWAQGGATWGDLDRETQPFGLAVSGGVVSETGIAGLTLSGGYSNARRAYGMTIDNVLAFEVVTASGRFVRADATEHADLYWALRGGGGNFGVVTAFEYRAQPLGPEVYVVQTIHPAERAEELLGAWRDAVADAPDEITSEFLFWSLPADPELPAELHGMPVVIVFATYAGPAGEGEGALRAVRSLGAPIVDLSGTMPYLALQTSLDHLVPAGRRYYWKALALDRLDDAAIALIADRSRRAPSPLGPVVIRQLGGAIARVAPAATAFGDRSAPFNLSIDAAWEQPDDDARNIEWARAFWDDARPFSNGQTYFNFPGQLEEGDAAVRSSYGENYERLVDVKTAYDPGNLFRLNQNIRPRG